MNNAYLSRSSTQKEADDQGSGWSNVGIEVQLGGLGTVSPSRSVLGFSGFRVDKT